MAPIQAAKVDAVASTIASVRKEGSHDINMHLPTKEQPILRALFEFRHSLNALRKNSHGAVTLADMNAKATELAAIMMQMKNARANEYDLDIPRNRVDDLLDTVWMNMFSMWAKIEAVNETIYPTYVSLVTLSRTADALRASCSWTPADVQPLQERLNLLDETVAASEGKFLNTSSGSSTIPHGQAVMASLLNRVHRTVSFLVSENSTSGRFDELKDELEGLLEELDVFEANKFEINELIPVSKRLHEIESRLGYDFFFPPLARSDSSNRTNNTEPGFATVSGMLNMCLNKLADLVADLDPVTESSPLFSAFKALSEADQELSNLLDNTDFRQDTEFTHSSIARIQNRLQELEKQRVNGTFVPLSFSFEDAVKLPGQGAMHKILHQCHSKLFRLLEPASEPIVGEKLMEVYEQLMKNRSTLRRLRAYASAGWNVASDLDIITQEQQAVEARLAKAGTADSDDDAEFGRLLGSRSNALSTGMGAVWALLDECDSLLWNTRCAIVAATATK
ncbi:hypothetical protein HDU83_006449 [Entophlyctis luteolus]|nr:hypothetical protein HDU83_006449 [Entophlyctis luteolus]KAJ3392339.1 hypothetical protein HDU84_004303 [Entophlyctis sp. JEL0112]